MEKVRKLGIIPEGMDSLVVNQMVFQMKRGRNGLEKKDLAILDNIATADWERPIYINNTSMQQISYDLSPYAVLEGNAFRILPVRNPNPREDFVNTEVMYENVMNKFYFRELDNPNVYFSQDYRNFVQNHRDALNILAGDLINKGDKEKARKVLLKSLEEIPDKAIRYDLTNSTMVSLLFDVGEEEKALEIAETMGDRAIEMLDYLISNRSEIDLNLQKNLFILGELQRSLNANGHSELAQKYEGAYNEAVGNIQQFNRGQL